MGRYLAGKLTAARPHAQQQAVTIDQQIVDGGIVLGDTPGHGLSVDESAIHGNQQSGSWLLSEGPHVRPARAGLRLVAGSDRRDAVS